MRQALEHHRAGRLDKAEEILRRALESQPQSPELHAQLGLTLKAQGRLEQAIAAFRRALTLRPEFAEAHNNLGNALKAAGEPGPAIEAYRHALTLRPDLAETHNNLGNALRETGYADEAVAAYRQALALRPNYAEAHYNLGNALMEQRQFDAAIAALRQAVVLRPHFPEAFNNLGGALQDKGELDEAIACYRQAIALRPGYAEAYNNLGNALKEAGQLDETLACYRQSLKLGGDWRIASNLLHAIHFHPDYDIKRIWEEHVRWNQTYALPLAPTGESFENDRSPDRRLRIGYVSPDFGEHPVGRFMLPLLENHDHTQFEIFCYADGRRDDAITRRLRARADAWRSTTGLSDEQLASLVRQDRIDILVDLVMHMRGTRMLVFARKPAPVQVTYLAYCSTSGLETIDYRLTDQYLDPPPSDDRFYSEESIHLPRCYWCYPAAEQAPDVAPLPALAAGHVTFGCLNNFGKVSAGALSTWSQLLRQVPNSRFLLHAHEGSHRDRTRRQLAAAGIDPDRLQFVAMQSMTQYFHQHNRIDIALDPFPYPGGTTTCDALWMGVPVVSRAGQTAVSRAGLSILSNAGLSELVAHDAEQYVQIATELAGDLSRLHQLRVDLRPRMRRSALMDAPRFTADVEAAFRRMWSQ